MNTYRWICNFTMLCLLLGGCAPQPGQTTRTIPATTSATLTLTSPDIAAGETVPLAHIYNRDGCGGGNIAPGLQWSGAPPKTKAFAVTLFDPDAPNDGKGWWHWAAYNLPASTTRLAQGKLPAGAMQARNDWGTAAYGGPCPPQGSPPHRYVFTLYALDTANLDVASGKAADVDALAKSHALGQATLTAYYGR